MGPFHLRLLPIRPGPQVLAFAAPSRDGAPSRHRDRDLLERRPVGGSQRAHLGLDLAKDTGRPLLLNTLGVTVVAILAGYLAERLQ